MSNRGLGRWLESLRRQATAEPDVVPDGSLLRRYARDGDQAAFELLVRRHGSLVLSVARRVLRDEHAAEDAFQATFLALARARSLESSACVAGWLYRVAQRIAFRAQPRAPAARPAPDTGSDPSAAAQRSELRGILDEEVNRLPDHYRMPIVLCYLSGRTTEEAARQLGCPRGTILSRLAGAREKLRGRLTRRGLAIPSAALAAGLASESAPAAVGGSLVALALQTTGPAAALAPGVVALTEGVLHAMFFAKVKIALAVVLASGVIGVGVLAGPGQTPAPGDVPPVRPANPAQARTPPPQPNPEPSGEAEKAVAAFGTFTATDSETPEALLMRQKFESAARELTLRYQEYLIGRGSLDSMLGAARRLRDAGQDLARKPDERLQALKGFRALAEAVYLLNKLRYESGAIKQQDVEVARYELLDADLRLLRAQRPANAGSK